MTNAKEIAAIREFLANIENCADMTDRKYSVQILAKALGKADAESVSRSVGLSNPYYFKGW